MRSASSTAPLSASACAEHGHLKIAVDAAALRRVRARTSWRALTAPQLRSQAERRPRWPGQHLPGQRGLRELPLALATRTLHGSGWSVTATARRTLQHVVVDRIGRTSLGFFCGEGGILDRQLPRQLVGRVVGLARASTSMSRAADASDDTVASCGRPPARYRQLADQEIPRPGRKDNEQNGDQHY